MIKVDENEPIGELEAKFPYRDVQIKRGVDVKEFYNLEAEIGRGKFGTVYLCREKKTNLSLAAKFVGIQRRQDRKNVEREVEIMRTLQHPRLIQLYDAFETDNTMVVVLELIEGGELFERVIGDDFILTEKACTIFMRQICEGVAFIHKNNIIHLDLKPENILCLTKTGNRIKIIDFGLARHYEPGSKMQVLFGTPEFVAPEVVNFDQISPATDMWSVGVICYVLLSGLSPFMGDTDVETMANVTLGRYDFEDESFDNISDNAKDFIANLLLNKKEARLTADESLKHPWLRKKIPPPPPELVATKENLKTFVENYNSTNLLAENGIDNLMINTKPSLNAVELIEASDKEFFNRDGAKCFSKLGNEQILHPVSLPDVLTNNDVIPVVNDIESPVLLVPPAVNNVSDTNDEMLTSVKTDYNSMPIPPVLDNASSIVSANSPSVVDVAANANVVQDKSMIAVVNNDAPVTLLTPAASLGEVTENMQPNLIPRAVHNITPNVIPKQEVPVAPLPFISKSLPAAAALLDENFVGRWPPIPISTLPESVELDEPIIDHPPVVATTLPPKRGSIDIGTLTPKRGSIDVANFLQKSGSPEISSFLQKRDSKDLGSNLLKRFSSDLGRVGSRRESMSNDETTNLVIPTPNVASPFSNVIPPTFVEKEANPKTDQTVLSTVEHIVSQPPIDVSPGIGSLEVRVKQLSSEPTAVTNVSYISKPDIALTTTDSTSSKVADVFLPQPPVVAKVGLISPAPPSPKPPPSVTPVPIPEVADYKVPLTIQASPLKTQSPQLFSPELPRTPTSPSSPSIFSPIRRESPLQKTLDEIPKLSSEILSSLTNLSSISTVSTFEGTSKKDAEVRSNSGTVETNKVSGFERVSSPRLMSFTDHRPSSLVGSLPSKSYSTIGSTFSRTKTEDKSAFATVTSKTYSTSSITTKRSESKGKDLDEQNSSKIESKKSTIEVDSQGFKPKLRSTAPWFSLSKTEKETNIEQKSTNISSLLKENLGPLERSRWAREVRQISAKLVELSKDQTNRKQQEEEYQMELNRQQTARRQKFKLSVLNRDVVFGEAREFYVSGEVPLGAYGASQMKQSNSSTTSTSSYSSRRTSPEKNTKQFTRSTAK